MKITAAPVQCPQCTSTVIRRSHRRGNERLLSLLGIYPFRCEDCRCRFRRLGLGAGKVRQRDPRSALRRAVQALSRGGQMLLSFLVGSNSP
jgi:hypothetical protein